MSGEKKEDQEDRAAPETGAQPASWTPELLAKRRARAKVMAWALAALIALFFIVTIVRLGGNVADRVM
ncbi:hypothetical protein ACSHT0_11385 [Tepidicaulis sp. LMO-SS28]|uniref:hypothetical protein n=1 Tax=Tepidicaulis sp. LMO-SS28 TaxID=3447455 RepID=UPI003EE15ED5